MIIVDVQVPALDTEYDFWLAEDIKVETIIEELAEMICQRERLIAPADTTNLTLFCVSNNKILPKESTLTECGVITGNRLILV